MKKSLLFLMSRSPYSGTYAQEMLDVIMTAAAFDQRVELLFVDDGVFQLQKNQVTKASGLKNISSMVQALPIYEITKFYVEFESLQERGLDPADLLLDIRVVSRNQVETIAASFCHVYNS